MVQPHRATLRVRPETEEAVFVRKLARAIVLRAIQDLLSSHDRHADGAGLGDQSMSPEWIFGEDLPGSFQTWCNLAGLRPNAFQIPAKGLMASNPPERHYRLADCDRK
jgi:hypothetical protein